MNGSKIGRAVTRIALPGIAVALAACATAPPAQESIVDALANEQSSVGPHSCAALDTAAVCEKTTRLGATRNCRCVDPRALAEGRPVRF